MTNGGLSYFDIAVVIILIVLVIKGYKSGFTEELMRIIGTVVSLLLAVKFMSNLSLPIVGATNIPPTIATIIACASIFTFSLLCFRFITEKMKKAINFSVFLGKADKALGGALGLFKGAIIISLITFLLSIFSFSDSFQKYMSGSLLYDPMRRIAPMVYDFLKAVMPEKRPFSVEFEENFSGIEYERRGQATNAAIEYYKKKR